jgi:S-disulfanyl-L-cysteine oxidoreductase SoxD
MSRRRMLTVTGSLLSIGAALAACSSSASKSATLAKSSQTFSEQTSAGQALYGDHCANCHGDAGQGTAKAPRVVGLKEGALPVEPPADRKFRKSRFVTVADVADFAVKNMPPNKGGSLTDDEYWAILAFDLHANGINLDKKLTAATARELKIPR